MELIITEKQNTAKRIAHILSDGKAGHRKEHGVDVFEFDDRTVMGLSGHIVAVDFPQEYGSWSRVDISDLIRAEIVGVPVQRNFVSALRKLGENADKVIIATDFDREGELIGVEALRFIDAVNPDVEIKRAKYSAITPEDIANAFDNLSDVDYDLASAAETRQVIDLVWGATLTRFISISAGRLGDQFLSVGRVQSPTLTLLVDRERELDAFVPEPYWEIYIQITHDGGEFTAKHAEDRFWKHNEAEQVMNKLSKHDPLTGIVSSVSKKKRKDNPPTPFNTTEFLGAANTLGYSAANAMRIAEWLYTSGYISYPRTDNTVYPGTLDLHSILGMLSGTEFEEYASKLLAKKKLTPTRGKKQTTDHPPIYPVSKPPKSKLNKNQWGIYELVVRRFLATLSDPALWENINLEVDVDGETFKARGSRLLQAGWREIYTYYSSKENIIPELKEGADVTVAGLNMEDKETQPPPRYSQGALIRKMEDLGLGTKSTRHEIISKLYSRAYIYGNPLQPTKKAYAVIESLENHADMIAKPDMTSTLEENMDYIAEGGRTSAEVVEKSRDMLEDVFRDLTKHRDEISESLREGLREDETIGTCPECASDLIVRRSRRGGRFIGCSGYPNCTFSLPLPRKGGLLITDEKCDEHDMHYVRIISKGRRPWDLGCPYCNYLEWQKSQKEQADEIPE